MGCPRFEIIVEMFRAKLKSLVWSYNLRRYKMEHLIIPHPPLSESNDEGAKEQKRTILASLKWGKGRSRCSIYFVQDCIQGFNVTRQREPVIRNSYVKTFNGNTRKWCMSQSRASELKGNADNVKFRYYRLSVFWSFVLSQYTA